MRSELVQSGDQGQAAYQASSIVVSEDWRATWTSHLLGRGVLTSSVAIGGASGICAAGEGTVTSGDGGATWSGAALAPAAWARADFVGPSVGWSTTGTPRADGGLTHHPLDHGEYILHTTDGVTWQEQYSSTGRYFLGVDFADA